eukprot:10934689-Lingulodinium_polyedra.AAC.1
MTSTVPASMAMRVVGTRPHTKVGRCAPSSLKSAPNCTSDCKTSACCPFWRPRGAVAPSSSRMLIF